MKITKPPGWRIEDVQNELGLSTSQAYRTVNRPDFPEPIAIYGTVMVFAPDAVRRYARHRKAKKRAG